MLKKLRFRLSRLSGNLAKTERASTVFTDRSLTEEEFRIAERLLLDAGPQATPYLAQLSSARVTGHCSCGCPTVDLRVEENLRAEPVVNPVAEMLGEVKGCLVGVMLLQRDGYLVCLEAYDLSEIERPYDWPALDTIRPFEEKR